MDRQRAKELLPIIQAFAEGKEIQWRYGSEFWYTTTEHPQLDFEHDREYRIKPEPREFWIWHSADGETLWRETYGPDDGDRDAIKVREVLE